MEKEQLIIELKYFSIRALFLDISAYLISAFFIGFTLSMALGLVLGTLGMIVNLVLLNNSIKNIVKDGGRSSRARMLSGYIIRLGITGVIVAAAMMIPFINTAGAVVPYFYPNLVYAGKALLKKGDKTE
ncbi:MAG: ATP synthase subunit I [Clostridium sp.]|nr:ATP synthase subunit I [Clostridium sp.]MCM1548204.1 ATP synthase subunit I [Ruminococcus sp.]